MDTKEEKEGITEGITPKMLCDLGLTVSFSQARRLIQCMPKERLQKHIEEAKKKRHEK